MSSAVSSALRPRAVTLPGRAYTHEVVTLWYRAPEILLGAREYDSSIDVWSFGAVVAEMARGSQPLCAGDSEIGQLLKTFRVLGTPNETLWPGVSKLPDFKEDMFPKWPPRPIREAVPHPDRLDDKGVDLIARCMAYPPAQRLSARAALAHPYFDGFATEAIGVAPFA